jgi:histidine triad (HIT) family protein
VVYTSIPMSCLFCEIVAGRIPSKKVFEDDAVYAFHDIDPQAPTHLLIVPRRHVASLNDLAPGDDALVGRLVRTARDLAAQLGFQERGYRVTFNCGDDAGYSVHHIHLHLLGGRKLGWPPG